MDLSLFRRTAGIALPALLGAVLTLAGAGPAEAATAPFFYAGTTVQTFTVPAGVTSITISARGAVGGGNATVLRGGGGASIQGDFTVTPGETLSILVGGSGANGQSVYGGGGGGGSFVWRGAGLAALNTGSLLVAAGGGGGVSGCSAGGITRPGLDASVATVGASGNPGGAGGPAPFGGVAGVGTGSGGGGAGIAGNGGLGAGGGGGVAIASSGMGGAGAVAPAGAGGYGGGGGAGTGGGGGGGYSGGGGGNGVIDSCEATNGGGGGGGSFNGGTNQANTAGAGAASGSVTIDYAGPAVTATIEQAAGQSDPTTVSPINFTATFSEPVAGFTGADISFAGSTARGPLSATVTPASGPAATYTVSVTGMTGPGTVVVSIPAGAVSPSNVASTSADNTVTFQVAGDATAPSCKLTAFRRAPNSPSGRDEMDVTVTDTGSGLQAVTNITASNAVVSVTPSTPFAPGTTQAVVTAIKTNQSATASFSFDVIDRAGNTRHCT